MSTPAANQVLNNESQAILADQASSRRRKSVAHESISQPVIVKDSYDSTFDQTPLRWKLGKLWVIERLQQPIREAFATARNPTSIDCADAPLLDLFHDLSVRDDGKQGRAAYYIPKQDRRKKTLDDPPEFGFSVHNQHERFHTSGNNVRKITD
jgi:hypothetical protein